MPKKVNKKTNKNQEKQKKIINKEKKHKIIFI
jgi:hypothetical protein